MRLERQSGRARDREADDVRRSGCTGSRLRRARLPSEAAMTELPQAGSSTDLSSPTNRVLIERAELSFDR